MAEETLWVLALLGGFSLLAGFVHSAIGFGFGIVAVALFPFVINTHDSHLVISVAAIPVLLSASWAYRGGIDWTSLRPALLGAAIFLPLGLWLFKSVSLEWLVRLTGLAVMVMVGLSMRNRSAAARATTSIASSFVAGAVGGFLAGAVSIAGPPIAAYGLRQGWSPDRFKAFIAQCLLLISIYKVAGLWLGNMLAASDLWRAGWITPFAVIGIELGVIASRYVNATRFYWLVATALIFIGITFLLV